jgi:hypothetical protein
MATLGILINHYDARNDIRDLVVELARSHKVVLLGPQGSVHPKHLHSGIEFRPCRRVGRFRSWVIAQLYRHFGFIPKSKDHFFINELFKIEPLTGFRRLKAKLTLFIRMHAPFRIMPETFLNALKDCDTTPVDDIDGFLLITEFSDNALTARIVSSGKPNCAYVYSWDHPCKHTVMTRGVKRYAVWNSNLTEDMVELQSIDRGSCQVVGATQLAPITTYLSSAPSPSQGTLEGRPYFYFGCGVGPLALAKEEMEVARRLAQVLRSRAPGHLLLVRPYPMSHGVDLRPMLQNLENVRWDDDFRSNQVGRSLGSANISQRLALQRGCTAFFHIGTTMGFEGAFLDIPCVLLRPPRKCELDADKFQKLVEFSDQYHLQKHLAFAGNTVGLGSDLDRLVKELLSGDQTVKSTNKLVRADTPILPMRELADKLAELSLG